MSGSGCFLFRRAGRGFSVSMLGAGMHKLVVLELCLEIG